MRIDCIGGGPAGLYFAILTKKACPEDEITVFERNNKNDTFGFGVVFSDATLEHLEESDRPSYEAIIREFYHWDEIDIFFRGQRLRSTGHGFSGLSRKTLLRVLEDRATEVGVVLKHGQDVQDLEGLGEADLVVVADGVNSTMRDRYAEHFEPSVDLRPNRFVWLGTTFPFEAFTFYFNENEAGLFQVHAYRYEEGISTFIVECSEETFKRSGLDPNDEDATATYLEKVFEKELAGHRLLKNRSIWRQFPTVRNTHWHHRNMVLIGDAAHTAHYSIGSGTKLALEDAIALKNAWVAHRHGGQPTEKTLTVYEAERRGLVDSTQRAAQVSLEWFESTERYQKLDPIEFAFSLLTRSLRVTHDNLQVRDPAFIDEVDRYFESVAEKQSGVAAKDIIGRRPDRPVPPMFTPFRMRDCLLQNRVVVSPMCQYSAEDGTVDDWHLVHLGSRAIGGAGLILAEMTDISRDGRITPGCAGMYKPEHATSWKRITDFVHRHSHAKIGLQLGHAGRKGATKLMWEGIDRPLSDGQWPIVSASPLPYFPNSQVPKALDRQQMDLVIADFVRATEMALQADFDMLELHFAHGYLLASFLSPLTNHRSDEYGGSIENRLRFPMSVFEAVRKAWPASKPISVRVSATDWAHGGLSPEDLLAIARRLKHSECDIIDVSSGQTAPDAKPVYGRLYQTPFSDFVRNEVGIPTMTVGNVSSYTDVNGILAARRADLCVLARAHLYDPYWTRHAANAQSFDLPWPNQYPLKGYSPRFE